MTVDERSRRELHQALVESLGDGPAGTMMEFLPRDPASVLATRRDLESIASGLRGEMAEVRGEMAEVRAEISAMKSEIAAEFVAVRGEMAAMKGGLESQIARLLSVVIGTQLATFLATIGFVVAFA